jgi:hypothetical protein
MANPEYINILKKLPAEETGDNLEVVEFLPVSNSSVAQLEVLPRGYPSILHRLGWRTACFRSKLTERGAPPQAHLSIGRPLLKIFFDPSRTFEALPTETQKKVRKETDESILGHGGVMPTLVPTMIVHFEAGRSLQAIVHPMGTVPEDYKNIPENQQRAVSVGDGVISKDETSAMRGMFNSLVLATDVVLELD